MPANQVMALSVAQPWAWMIIHGGKRVENRRWATTYSGRLIIHASKSRFYLDEAEMAELRKFAPSLPTIDKLDFGAFIGHVNLVGCFNKHDGQAIDPRFAQGPFCWALTDPKPLPEPIVGRGQLYLFEPPDQVLRTAGLFYDYEEQMRVAVAGENQRHDQMKGVAAAATAKSSQSTGVIRRGIHQFKPGDRVTPRQRTFLESYQLIGVFGTIRAAATFNGMYQRCTVAWDNGRVMDSIINDLIEPAGAVVERSAV